MTITGATKILGLIADPVVRARSPAFVNALLEQRGRFGEWALVPMQVSANGLAGVIDGLRQVHNFGGAIVSMPHKTTVTALVDELTDEARLVGAVNVLRRHSNGRLVGTILDGEGFVGGLASAGHRVAGATVLLSGAGGAASAVAFALAKHGCSVLCLINRTQSKADELATRIKAALPHVIVTNRVRADDQFDIAINGTSLGMNPGDALPLSNSVIERSALIAECVIAPEITPLLELARQRGRAIHTGVPMLLAQLDMMLAFMGVE